MSEYHIPAHVREHVDYVTPGIRLRPTRKAGFKKRNAKRADTHGLKPGNTVYHVGKPTHPVDLVKLKSFAPNAADSLPGVNSTTCSTFITTDCVRGTYYSLDHDHFLSDSL